VQCAGVTKRCKSDAKRRVSRDLLMPLKKAVEKGTRGVLADLTRIKTVDGAAG
jgi:hypothetical protein